MFGDKNAIEEQSFFLDFDIEKQKINGFTKIRLKLDNPEFLVENSLVFCLNAK